MDDPYRPRDLDGTLAFVYDDAPSDSPPIYPRPPDRRGFWERWLGWLTRPRTWRDTPRTWRDPPLPGERGGPRWPHPIRWLGNLLVHLAAADPENLGSRAERNRYITIGLLMLVTAAQAFYAATLFFSVSLARPFRHEIVYGIFFALAVYLIDRSIISYASPVRVDKGGNLAAPKKASWVLGIRVVIALVAALLMSEMILLQVFAGDITLQIQTNHLAVTQATDNKIEANYQGQVNKLQAQINTAQAVVLQRQSDVNSDYQAMNCQEFGCPGIAAGLGPGFRAAQQTFQAAQQRLTDAQDQLQAIRNKNLPLIQRLNTEEQQAISNAQPAISNADKVLSQEAAFWQLTVKNGTVLVVRLLLSLLVLGIDLAPILTKLTGRTSLHDFRAYSSDFVAAEKSKHEMSTAVYRLTKQAGVDRRAYDLEMGSALYEAEQDAEVRRARIKGRADVARAEVEGDAQVGLYHRKLIVSLQLHEHHHDYMIRKARYSGWGQGGGNGGWRGGGMGGGPGGGPGQPPDPDAVAHPAGQLAAFHQPSGQELADPGPPLPGADGPGPEPDPPDPTELDEVVNILLPPAEPSGMLVLDHKWILHDRLPQADHGGGGIVWRATNQLDDQRVRYVVKTVPNGLVDKRTTIYIQQLGVRHEERVSGLVSDDHIGQIIDQGDDRGFSYLVYPLYEPGSLGIYCRLFLERPLGWCAQVSYEVLSGLIAASAAGLMHLDIKPGNIVLDGDHARVIDWGLSRVWNASQPSTWIARGTPFFACPEQLIEPDEEWGTPCADLYGVGATFYWLLTGEAPLQNEARGRYDLLEYRRLLVGGIRPQPVHELVPGVPRPLGALIDRWLSFYPADRVPRGTLMRDSLRAARDELDALRPLLPQMMVGQVTGRRRRRRN